MDVNRWLARLAFSFLILAGFLVWQGYREMTTLANPAWWRIGLYFVAAGVSVGLGVRGIRERHRLYRD